MQYNPKTEIVQSATRWMPIAIVCLQEHIHCVDIPGTTPNVPIVVTGDILFVRAPLGQTPLGEIAAHVQYAVGAGAGWMAIDVCRLPGPIGAVRTSFIDRRVSPWIRAGGIAKRGALPFQL